MTFIARKKGKDIIFNKLITCGKCGKYYIYKPGKKQPFYVCGDSSSGGLCKSRHLGEDVLIKMVGELGGIENISGISALDYDLTFTLKDGSIVKKTYVTPSKKESWTQAIKEQTSQTEIDYYQNMEIDAKNKYASEYNKTIDLMNNKQALSFIRTIIFAQFSYETFFEKDIYSNIKDKLVSLYNDLLKDSSLENGDNNHSSIINSIGELCWKNAKDHSVLNQFANHANAGWKVGKMISLVEFGINR